MSRGPTTLLEHVWELRDDALLSAPPHSVSQQHNESKNTSLLFAARIFVPKLDKEASLAHFTCHAVAPIALCNVHILGISIPLMLMLGYDIRRMRHAAGNISRGNCRESRGGGSLDSGWNMMETIKVVLKFVLLKPWNIDILLMNANWTFTFSVCTSQWWQLTISITLH